MTGALLRAIVAISLTLAHIGPQPAVSTSAEECANKPYPGGSSISLPASSPVTPSATGAVYPVLFIHGFNGTPSSWTTPATVTWLTNPPSTKQKSFVQWVNGIPGALPVLFDYHDHGLDWVDNDAIGGALNQVIDCLAGRSGQQVAVVAHSMGGLAVRQALNNNARAAQVSLVVTIGTPNLGSFWPNVIAGTARNAVAIAAWTQTAANLGAGNMDSAAFSAGYRMAQALIDNCERQIAQTATSGICGEVTPIIGAMKSPAGEALAAGSQKLADLPKWPTSVTVYALSSNYKGFGMDDWLGDGVVPPQSAIAGAPGFSSTQCDLAARPWLQNPWVPVNGCWHVDQPINQNLIPLALTKLHDDIAARSQPAVDWKNTTYTATCDGIVQNGFQATLSSGVATVPSVAAGVSNFDHFELKFETSVTGNLTGGNSPETAVLLYCTPQPSNFYVEEVEVLSSDGRLIGELPSTESLKDSSAALPPIYLASELTMNAGNISAGMMFYGPNDSHASGPSEHRIVVWHWDGQSFTRVS